MKTNILSILSGICLLLLSSCEKYLDIKPKGYVIPQTVEEYERILNNAKMTKLLSDGIEQLADDFYNPTLVKDNRIQEVDYRLYFWLPSPYTTPEDYTYNSYWNMMYAAIYQYNAILNGIDQATGATEERKKIARAKALVGRSICYFYLANLYTQQYNETTATSSPGIPLVTSNDITQKLPNRGTVKETFDFILKGFEDAISDLPTTSLSNFEINRAGAYGWLARTYLSMNKYKEARLAAEEALKINSTLVDYNTQYTVFQPEEGPAIYTPKSGHIFIRPDEQPENLNIVYYGYTRGMAFQYIAKETESLFDPKDLRRINLVPSYISNSEPYAKWDKKYMYMGYSSYEYSAGPSTPEMQLIKAEGLARNGQVIEALVPLNLLRKNRIATDSYQPIVSTDKNTVLDIIYKERRRELLFKGIRWFDMRRLNSDPDFGFTAKHELADGTFIELKPGNPRYVLSIPDPAITDGITQNP
ncbi:RagB/SusD family nutrient uptake outer membrane protein [Sphingobacterium tabacisoli]|uniref:RagB/SusD family nutrient uptake outer membrane protein n=1 Tax=Sphingobacterium tabacisoli TaxID=2044855 RepID=A0ABW5LA47_9SPHI|nr:RagB/SusD family nutrient uptake outer membrane protein [Sphingobacterium tabacisoli]